MTLVAAAAVSTAVSVTVAVVLPVGAPTFGAAPDLGTQHPVPEDHESNSANYKVCGQLDFTSLRSIADRI